MQRTLALLILFNLIFSACTKPVPGPDKSLAGTVIGGAWGSGAGAIVGHQFAAIGPGIAIGAGFAAVSGLITGASLDMLEGNQLHTQRQLKSLRHIQAENHRRLLALENESYYEGTPKLIHSPFLEVFFDKQRASLKLASVKQIAHIAESLRNNRLGSYQITLKGFSTDFEGEERNNSLISARLKSVSNILQSHGIPDSAIKLQEPRTKDDKSKMKENILIAEDKNYPARLNNRVELLVSYL